MTKNALKDVGKAKHLFTVGGSINWCIHHKLSAEAPEKAKNCQRGNTYSL